MRHYSKVLVSLPDNPHDPPYAIVSVDCEVCGELEARLHVAHLGTVLRALQKIVDTIQDDGVTDQTSPLMEGTPANRAEVRKFLDAAFPDWTAERIRRRRDEDRDTLASFLDELNRDATETLELYRRIRVEDLRLLRHAHLKDQAANADKPASLVFGAGRLALIDFVLKEKGDDG